MPITIYALCEPDLQIPVIRYIGKTVNLKDRFTNHLSQSVKMHSRLGHWLQSLKSRGERPVLMTLTEVPNEMGSKTEILYIRLAREGGMDLVNLTEGGDGGSVLPEVRKQISESSRGKVRPPEHCAALSRANAGKPPSKACNVGRAKACTGRIQSQEERNRRGWAVRGYKHAGATSRFIGVSWCSRGFNWAVFLNANGVRKGIGRFECELDAARAYDKAAVALLGYEAKLNFPISSCGS